MSINSTLSRMFSAIIFAALVCVSMSCFGKKTDKKSSEPATIKTELVIATEDLKTLTLDLGDGVSLELVLIPAGEFMMGSNECFDAYPVHHVRISKPFYMGKYEVTQEQYEKIMGTNPSHFKGVNNPVETVSWDDADVFCNQLSFIMNRTISLPTEAQWEYACRAGTTTRWHFGDDESHLGEYAWYDSNSGGKTQPVGQKKPNAWGLYDMHGNVWEWCSDFYGAYLIRTETDPSVPLFNSHRIFRSGGLDCIARYSRSASRYGNNPGYRGETLGFRVVAVPRE